MADMVERVARAICRVDLLAIAMEDNITLSPNGLDASVDKSWRSAIPNARAALEAMRHTSNAMDVAGCIYLRDNPSDASGTFETMLDAALREPNEEEKRSGE